MEGEGGARAGDVCPGPSHSSSTLTHPHSPRHNHHQQQKQQQQVRYGAHGEVSLNGEVVGTSKEQLKAQAIRLIRECVCFVSLGVGCGLSLTWLHPSLTPTHSLTHLLPSRTHKRTLTPNMSGALICFAETLDTLADERVLSMQLTYNDACPKVCEGTVALSLSLVAYAIVPSPHHATPSPPCLRVIPSFPHLTMHPPTHHHTTTRSGSPSTSAPPPRTSACPWTTPAPSASRSVSE